MQLFNRAIVVSILSSTFVLECEENFRLATHTSLDFVWQFEFRHCSHTTASRVNNYDNLSLLLNYQ